MSPVFATQTDSNKRTPTKGQKLADVIGGAKLDDVGLYNWGTKDHAEINRALIELVGCQKVDDADPLQSELDPALGTGGAIYLPEEWKPEAPFELGKTHTFKLKKRLPMPAVAITKMTSWFIPETEECKIRYRLEGVAARANKTDLEVHVARYVDHKGESQSSYYAIKEERRETHPSRATASLTDNPVEKSEVASGTDGPKDTHIWRDHKDGVAPSPEVKVTWDGESTAKEGVLKPKGTNKAYINSSCAPYSVVVRYYKSDDDKAATIFFNESFYPRWKVEAGGTRKLDPTSLVVKWTVKHGTKKKLVLGQLQVFDKAGDIVFRVGLDDGKLSAGKLDLAPLWPESEIKRTAMPYRVQIQAHSDPDEAEGLALAVMPTQVRAFDYERVQFLAFNVRPPSPYAGDPDHDTDIDARVAAMIDAIEEADILSDTDDNVLKIFMAPEFYFRGPAGAYPVEKLSTIVPKLRVESDKIDYADWMFVFGSAIGYEKHEAPGGQWTVHKPPTHDFILSAITATEVTATAPLATATKETGVIPLVGWRIRQGGKSRLVNAVTEVVKYKQYKLTITPGVVFSPGPAVIEVTNLVLLETDPANSTAVTRIRVKGRVCYRIPSTTVAGLRWEVHQGAVNALITQCVPHATNADQFWLTLDTPKAFQANVPMSLMEPASTEVTNVALVQKGYPSPYMGDGSLRHVAIYKEHISPIDFKHGAGNLWHTADASKRAILIHGTPDRPVLPTAGSADLAGASPNVTRQPGETAGSEINKTGIGGGVVYTMDDITFGLEVCLDHGKNRLADFYGPTGNKAAGDPKIQIQLIPSWGMSIGEGEICTAPNTGPIFNVDGSRVQTVARVYDGTYGCNDHPDETGPCGNACDVTEKHYFCPLCSTVVSDTPGNCDFHTTTALEELSKCGMPKYFACNSGCWAKTVPCWHPGMVGLYVCGSCGVWCRWGTTCGCPNPKPVTVNCPQGLYDTPDCPTCGEVNDGCHNMFQNLGSALVPSGPAVDVASSRDQKYFQRWGRVVAYDPVEIPDPDVV